MSQLLKGLFGSGARVKILRLLLLNPHERYYQRQLAQILSLPVRSVQQEIPHLEKLMIILSEEDGNRRYLRANRQCPIFPELQRIFLKASDVAAALQTYLKRHQDSIRAAFIYGSYAKGQEESWSDIDLMVIGDIQNRILGSLIFDARKGVNRELNYLHYTPEEFRNKAKAKDHFLIDVLEGKKVFVVGDERELAKLVK